MSGDWSLKGKRIYIDEGFYDDDFYKEEDIETLRQKLIEDIKNQSFADGQIDCQWDELVEVINKRFGVEE